MIQKTGHPTNIRQAGIMKGIIDGETADAGGQAYKRARQERSRFAQNYENIGLVKRLIGTKRGTTDRTVALENVLDEAIFKAPMD